MHYIVAFETDHFDLKSEKENPINSIRGLSVGEWIVPLDKERAFLKVILLKNKMQGNDELLKI